MSYKSKSFFSEQEQFGNINSQSNLKILSKNSFSFSSFNNSSGLLQKESYNEILIKETNHETLESKDEDILPNLLEESNLIHFVPAYVLNAFKNKF